MATIRRFLIMGSVSVILRVIIAAFLFMGMIPPAANPAVAARGVGQMEVEKTSGYALLDEAAMETVRLWRFKPARKGRVAVTCRVNIPVDFNYRRAAARAPVNHREVNFQ